MKILAIILLGLSVGIASANRRNVCYWGTWAHYRPNAEGRFQVGDIDPTLCTHIMYAFMNADQNGNIIHTDQWLDINLNYISQFIALRQRSPSTKFLFSVGGATAGSATFSRIAASQVARANFAQSTLAFARRFGFDGMDFDWEYPAHGTGSSPADRNNFVLLLTEVYRVLRGNGLEFSIAVAATESQARISYDIPRVAANVDFINLMTYDFHGSWNTFTGLHSAMYVGPRDTSDFSRQLNVQASVNFWISQGAPRSKLVVGIGAYGRSFTLASATNNGVGATASGAGNGGPHLGERGFLGYSEICTYIIRNNWRRVWEPTQMCPYAVSGTQWVGYDDLQSTQHKLEFIIRNTLGGSMFWSIDTEDHRNLCGNGRFPLVRLASTMMRS